MTNQLSTLWDYTRRSHKNDRQQPLADTRTGKERQEKTKNCHVIIEMTAVGNRDVQIQNG